MLDWLMPQMMYHGVSHNVHKFTLDVTYVQKGVQLVTKVCYYMEFSYICVSIQVSVSCGQERSWLLCKKIRAILTVRWWRRRKMFPTAEPAVFSPGAVRACSLESL